MIIIKKKTIRAVLVQSETDDKPGLSRQEVSALINKGYNSNSFILNIAKIFMDVDKMTNSVFKTMDTSRDEIISLAECDEFIRKECNVSLKEVMVGTVEELCNRLDEAAKLKKKTKAP